MTRIFNFFTVVLIGLASCTTKDKTEISQWRGPNRDGIYQETGLLKEWPENGPEMLWSYEGLGYGHSSAVVTENNVFVTGIKDTVDAEGTLFCFDLDGKLRWQKIYGTDFNDSFQGPRSTPTVVDSLIYIESGLGTVYCLSAQNGKEIWNVNFARDLSVDSTIQFGYSESVLVDGDHLICVPGGKENNVVALNRFTGEKVWGSKGNGEKATYSSPIVIENNGKRLVIAMTAASIMGIDAGTGEMYWRIEHTQQNNIHANTPVFADGMLMVATADPTETSGMVMLKLSDDSKNAEVVWRNKKLRSFMGGFVKMDTSIYGSSYLRNNWEVIDWNTGETLAQNKDLCGGAIIYADGMFYGYAEREGEMALINANPEKFEVVSRFEITKGSQEHWAHPVIKHGKLFVRHGDALMVYNLKAS